VGWAENAATIMSDHQTERTKNDKNKIEKNEGVPFEDLIKGDALHEFGLCLYAPLYSFFLLLLQLLYLLLLLLLPLALLSLFVVLLPSRPRRHSQ
jgi:hypothetical protein